MTKPSAASSHTKASGNKPLLQKHQGQAGVKARARPPGRQAQHAHYQFPEEAVGTRLPRQEIL